MSGIDRCSFEWSAAHGKACATCASHIWSRTLCTCLLAIDVRVSFRYRDNVARRQLVTRRISGCGVQFVPDATLTVETLTVDMQSRSSRHRSIIRRFDSCSSLGPTVNAAIGTSRRAPSMHVSVRSSARSARRAPMKCSEVDARTAAASWLRALAGRRRRSQSLLVRHTAS